MRNILTNIINPLSPFATQYLPNQVICIEASKITSITPQTQFKGLAPEDYTQFVALPGFIDLHVHLSQYRMRGLYEPALLPWLNQHVFPEEARSQQDSYAIALSEQFFQATLAVGTTMSVIYTAPYASACSIAFEVAERMGIRAMIGMTMMDMNAPIGLVQGSKDSVESSVALFEKWHAKTDKLDYIFTPRFAPTCSVELMQQIGSYAVKHKAWIQTHLSENTSELAWVKEIFGQNSYTEVYHKAGLLSPKSIFGHAIHLTDKELNLLSETHSKIAHCPDSNFYLKSGEFPLERIEAAGIDYALGSDVGAGTVLNMLHHAKMMNFRQSQYPVLPAKALYHITLGSARLLGMEDKLGSLEAGKEADIVFMQAPDGFELGEQTLSQLIFFGSEFSVKETLVAGKSLYV